MAAFSYPGIRYEIAQVSPSWDPVVDNIPSADQWFAISSKDGCSASQHTAILCLRSRYLSLSGIKYEFAAEYSMNDCVVWKYQHKDSPSKHCQSARFWWRMSACDKLCCVSHAQLIRAASCVDVRLDIDYYPVRPDIDHHRAGKHDWQARASLDGKQVWSSVFRSRAPVDSDGLDQACASLADISKRELINTAKAVKEIVSSELTDNNLITTQTKVRYQIHHRHCHPTFSTPACIPGKRKNNVIYKQTKTKKTCAMPGATDGREQEELQE
jgi:hypothetical protein